MLRILLVLLLVAPALEAQETGDSTSHERTVLDGVFTDEQADGGEKVFNQRCSGCHAPFYFQERIFLRTWAGRPIRSLFRRLSTTMPEDNPGGLAPEEYAAVVAYILELNGYPSGETALPSDEEELRRILLVEKPEGG